MKFVRKYFIPNEENEYKPHFLRKAGIASVAIVALALFAVGVFQNFLFVRTDFLSAVLPPVLVDLANEDRLKNQVATLTVNPLLVKAAQAKANHMAENGYFSHNSPDGKTPWYWFAQAGYKYASAGENLAINFTDSYDVNTAWMNSPGHRANILNGKFTEIGIATAEGMYQGRPTVFVVQTFGRPAPTIAVAPAPKPIIATGPNATTSTSTSPIKPNATTTVLGESVSAPTESSTVLSSSEMFTETSEAQIEEAPLVISGSDKNASPVDHLAVQSKQIITLAYKILAGVVLLAILSLIFIEIKRQHPKMVFAGIVLLIFVLTLLYLYQNVLFGQVIIA